MKRTREEIIAIIKARITVLEENEWFIELIQTCSTVTECSERLKKRYSFNDLQVEGVLGMSLNMCAKAPVKKLRMELERLLSDFG